MVKENTTDFQILLRLSPLHKKYLETLADREHLKRNNVVRLIISDYIKRNPTGKIPRMTKEIVDQLPQNNPLEEIVDDMATGDISQICDYADCSNKDIRYFNQLIETIADDGEVITELELRSLCPTHYNFFTSEQGWKLELLD